MTYSLNDLRVVLDKHSSTKDIASVLAALLQNGYDSGVLSQVMYDFANNNHVESDYEDVLDELIAAMAGDCHSTYILHPSNYITDSAPRPMIMS